ncbi:hypothetical protein LPU83_pLPU83b_0201 (plasmid) [Rhizobium favelukesii]|uniref:Uncharacterized protein n=1 Tax=Rhizobium favelukesii TaxID=348824 RepID=W6RIQ2_9HYPH|nr:hypothetical protein LPU83_pLPU83b_0201 [Rhizobium favelukesii]
MKNDTVALSSYLSAAILAWRHHNMTARDIFARQGTLLAMFGSHEVARPSATQAMIKGWLGMIPTAEALLPLFEKGIAEGPHSSYENWLVYSVEGGAQMTDMNIDGAEAYMHIVRPRCILQFRSGVHPEWVFHQVM